MVLTALGLAPGAAQADDLAPTDEAYKGDVVVEGEREQKYGSKVLWGTASGGYGFVNLRTFQVTDSEDVTADVIASHLNGPGADVALGARLWNFTLGARGRLLALQGTSDTGPEDLNLWSLNAELGFHLPLGRTQPYLALGAGYSVIGGLEDAVPGLDISGANIRAGVGVTYYIVENVSIGAQASAELLFLNRRGVPLSNLATPRRLETVGDARLRALEADGSSIGAAYALIIGPGVHFL